jgi:hypothetical protein
MSRVTITIHVDLPEGMTPDVEYGAPSLVEPEYVHAPLPEIPQYDPDEIVRPSAVASQGGCPVHHVAWKTVPAGISKKTGKPYSAFQACPERGCDQKPAA